MSKAIVEPKIKGFICTTAHPEGCRAFVKEEIDYVQSQGKIQNGPKNVLVLGSSTGYGLASRIVAAFGSGADTLGVFFGRPAQGERTASAGWYNTVAFEDFAHAAGLKAKSINGDAFSDEVKQEVIQILKKDFGKVDLVVYSLAAPRRVHPKTGTIFSSVLKPIGEPFYGKTVNTDKGTVSEVSIQPATPKEVEDTIAVMGGEDWEMWMYALKEAGVLAEGVQTVAYSYIGPEITWRIYKDGTIGQAKKDLDRSVKKINEQLQDIGGKACIAVNKGVVTQASSAIPVVPLYISLLFKVMKAKGLHEDCIQQMYRLFRDHLYATEPAPRDEAGRVRIDDWEMREDVQEEVKRIWPQITTENLREMTDFDGYQKGFLKLFGFGFPEVDYSAPVERDIPLEKASS